MAVTLAVVDYHLRQAIAAERNLVPSGQLRKQRLRQWVYPDRGRKVLLVPNLGGVTLAEAGGQGRGKPTLPQT